MHVPPQATTITLLIADAGDRRLLGDFLTDAGHQVQLCDANDIAHCKFTGHLVIVDESQARGIGKALLQVKQHQLPLYLPVLLMIGPRSQASPWLRAGFDDVLRMPITKDELAARLRTFLQLRRHSEDQRHESRRFVASTLDALSEHVCVVDCDGNILLVNQAWRNFGSANGLPADTAWEKFNYFAVCNAAAESGSEQATAFVEGMRAVVSGRRTDFTFEYSCDSPLERRWFLAKVTRFTQKLNTILVVSHENVTETRHAEDAVVQLARYDPLTRLPNRAYFYDNLNRTLLQAQRGNAILAVLFIDLDHFKLINDTMGHGVGDEVLRQIAARITGGLRSSDMVGRLGGDEFCAYLPMLTQEQDAGQVADKIIASLSAPMIINGIEAFVTASVGVALYPHDATTVDALLNAADTAMYWAKELGRSNYQYFTPRMNDAALERANIEQGLRRALERGELFLVYQPQVDIASGRVCGCEALMRWKHPERGLISPATFIPIAEETGLIVAMGEWALRTACAQNRAWQEAGLPSISVAVNLSARQFKHNEVAATVSRVLKETGLEGRDLELELTESIVMEDVDRLIMTMHEIKSLGVRFSIDDFGTGYSNLGYLRRFPIDAVKIDRSFVEDIWEGGPDDGVIANMIITLGHNLKLKVIAEGVETAAQLAFLSIAGCDMAQGFYVSRPLSADEFYRFLADSTIEIPT